MIELDNGWRLYPIKKSGAVQRGDLSVKDE